MGSGTGGGGGYVTIVSAAYVKCLDVALDC